MSVVIVKKNLKGLFKWVVVDDVVIVDPAYWSEYLEVGQAL